MPFWPGRRISRRLSRSCCADCAESLAPAFASEFAIRGAILNLVVGASGICGRIWPGPARFSPRSKTGAASLAVASERDRSIARLAGYPAMTRAASALPSGVWRIGKRFLTASGSRVPAVNPSMSAMPRIREDSRREGGTRNDSPDRYGRIPSPVDKDAACGGSRRTGSGGASRSYPGKLPWPRSNDPPDRRGGGGIRPRARPSDRLHGLRFAEACRHPGGQ